MLLLDFSKKLHARLAEVDPLIQVILGPRQVGKTTASEQISLALPPSTKIHYASADAVFRSDWSWIERQWLIAEEGGQNTILVLDEIQKIDNWSEAVKRLWDASKRAQNKLKVVLLGSSSLALQTGLSESLTGRFELIRAYHWNFIESQQCFGYSLDDYLKWGGYPGANPFRTDEERWLAYLKSSIVETVLDKDILNLRHVTKPALFRQVFQLLCEFPAMEISLRKIVGQLQDPGSIETVKHYIELFEGAFLIKTLQKFSTNALQKKSSSPKILPLCPALCSFARGSWTFSPEIRGRLFELCVGTDLLRLPGELTYWREGQDEVDYVYKVGKNISAIEVKSGRKRSAHGLVKFKQAFPNARCLVVSPDNYSDFCRYPKAFLAE